MGREGWLVTAFVVLLAAAFCIAYLILPEVWLHEGRWRFGYERAGIYRDIGADSLSPVAARALARVFVPNVRSNDVSVIDPATLKVVDRFAVGSNPQHVVPSWDLKALWVTGSSEDHRRGEGSLTPVDPFTGKPGRIIPVPDAYNLYFTPDGHAAIVVAEEFKRLEFRDPHTMRLFRTLAVPQCNGINHADYSGDERYAIFTCEFGGALVKIDMTVPRIVGFLKLGRMSMPQDIRVGPDGKIFFVADMMQDGVVVIDGPHFAVIGLIPTGIGTHGLCVGRDGRELYVSNRGSHSVHGRPHGPGSISVIDFATRRVLHTWAVPGGGSPDMGNVSADGKTLWLSGRFDDVVYRVDTQTGAMKVIGVGREPHGLTVWPQPGRYSLGHTGNMR
jgi:YVTN family beta-propeller protein